MGNSKKSKSKSKNTARSPTSTTTLPLTNTEQALTATMEDPSSSSHLTVMTANPPPTTAETEQEKHSKVVGELAAQLLKHFLEMPQNNTAHDSPSTSKALQAYKPLEVERYSGPTLKPNICSAGTGTKKIMPTPVLATVNNEKKWVYLAEDVAGFCENPAHQTCAKICAVRPQIVENCRRALTNNINDLNYEINKVDDEEFTIKIRTLRRSARLIHKRGPIIVEIENENVVAEVVKGEAEHESVVMARKRKRTSCAVSSSQKRKHPKEAIMPKLSKRQRKKNKTRRLYTTIDEDVTKIPERENLEPNVYHHKQGEEATEKNNAVCEKKSLVPEKKRKKKNRDPNSDQAMKSNSEVLKKRKKRTKFLQINNETNK